VESDLVAVEEPLVSENKFLKALIAGGAAGTSVDVALFPIDTIKTRLQSPQGFLKAGGFKGIYRGLGAAAVGSAPGAALFFSTYEVCSDSLFELNKMKIGIYRVRHLHFMTPLCF